jgi:phage terminase large subunit GpA-like protein
MTTSTATKIQSAPEGLQALRQAIRRTNARTLKPPPKLRVSEWADARRQLSPEASAEPGKWETSRAEYQRGIQDAFSDSTVQQIVVMSAAQIGKTEILNNIVGYFIEQDPAPILVLQPTIEMGEAWSKDRLAPMLRDTPALQGLVKDPRARDSGNTLRHKTFPAGHLTIAGANSPSSLASRPIRIVLCDEVDRYPASAGSEGDPVELARKRTANFWNRKVALFSTPTNKDASRIERAWEGSDQRRFWVPCPECGTYRTLLWGQVVWDRDESGQHLPETARYVCADCGVPWTEAQRLRAIRRGEWRAEKPFRGVAGFHLSALYSPWADLCQLARDWLAALGHPDLQRVFINTALGELWEEKYHSLNPDKVHERCAPYPERGGTMLVPWGVSVITAGVDVQDDRLEVGIQGYGRGLEQWKLQYHVLDGDPSGTAVWEELAQLLYRPLPLERGGVEYIRATCVDTGAHTLRAYDFCRPRFRISMPDGRLAYVFAIKGQGGAGGSLWPREPSRNNKGKIPLYTLRVDAAKEGLYQSLEKIREPGPGYIHFPSNASAGRPFDARYFDQLTAEKVTTRRSRTGVPERVWEPKSAGRRNEALDCSVYAEAALRGLLAMGLDIDAEAARAEARKVDPETAPALPVPANPSSAARPVKRRRSSSSEWLRR